MSQPVNVVLMDSERGGYSSPGAGSGSLISMNVMEPSYVYSYVPRLSPVLLRTISILAVIEYPLPVCATVTVPPATGSA